MKAVAQRVKKTTLKVDGELISEIPFGLTVFLGVKVGDTEKEAAYLAKKIAGLRVFEDENGKMKISAQYEDARSFANGLAAVKVDGLWGFIDTEGEMVINPQFLDARDFNASGAAFVLAEDEWELLRLFKYNH